MRKILLAVLFLIFSSVVANASTDETKICSGFAKWMEDGTFKQIRESDKESVKKSAKAWLRYTDAEQERVRNLELRKQSLS